MFGISGPRIAEMVIILTVVLFVLYIFYRLNIFKKE